MLKSYPFIDKRKVAVWGWSYGGFLAARMLAEETEESDQQIVKCTISVAPVTKWSLYGECLS